MRLEIMFGFPPSTFGPKENATKEKLVNLVKEHQVECIWTQSNLEISN